MLKITTDFIHTFPTVCPCKQDISSVAIISVPGVLLKIQL